MAFLIYQYEQEHAPRWATATAWGEQIHGLLEQAGALTNYRPQSEVEKWDLLDSKTVDLKKKKHSFKNTDFGELIFFVCFSLSSLLLFLGVGGFFFQFNSFCSFLLLPRSEQPAGS